MYRKSLVEQKIGFNNTYSIYIKDLDILKAYNPGTYTNAVISYIYNYNSLFGLSNYPAILQNYSIFIIQIVLLLFMIWGYLFEMIIEIKLSFKKSVFYYFFIFIIPISNTFYYSIMGGFYSMVLVLIYILTAIYLALNDDNKQKYFPYILILLNTGVAFTWHHIYPITTLLLLIYLYKKKNTPYIFLILNLLISSVPIFYYHQSRGILTLLNDKGILKLYDRNEFILIILAYISLVISKDKIKKFIPLSFIILCFLCYAMLIYLTQLLTGDKIDYAYYKVLQPVMILSYLLLFIFIVRLLSKFDNLDKIFSLWLTYIMIFLLGVLTYFSISRSLLIFNKVDYELVNKAFGNYQQVHKLIDDDNFEVIPITNNYLQTLYIHLAYPELSPISREMIFLKEFEASSKIVERYILANYNSKNIILIDSFGYLSERINNKQYKTYKSLICKKKILIYPKLSSAKCKTY